MWRALISRVSHRDQPCDSDDRLASRSHVRRHARGGVRVVASVGSAVARVADPEDVDELADGCALTPLERDVEPWCERRPRSPSSVEDLVDVGAVVEAQGGVGLLNSPT